MRRPVLLALFGFLAAILPLRAQVSPSEQVQVGPPPVRRAEAPSPGATAEELEKRGDELKAEKAFLDAIDYYRAALERKRNDAVLLNKIGICELLMHRLPEARKDLERAIKANKTYADAYNNLGVVFYSEAAIRQTTDDSARPSSSTTEPSTSGRTQLPTTTTLGRLISPEKNSRKPARPTRRLCSWTRIFSSALRAVA